MTTKKMFFTEKGDIGPGLKKTVAVLTRNINLHPMSPMFYHRNSDATG